MQTAKQLLQEAVSGSKFAMEAVQQSETAHTEFQKVSLNPVLVASNLCCCCFTVVLLSQLSCKLDMHDIKHQLCNIWHDAVCLTCTIIS